MEKEMLEMNFSAQINKRFLENGIISQIK